MKQFLKNWLSQILSSISVIVAIVDLVSKVHSAALWTLIAVITGFIITQLLVAWFEKKKTTNIATSTDCFNLLSLDYNRLMRSSKIYPKINKSEHKNQVKDDLERILNDLCTILLKHTNLNFCASIKIIYNDPNKQNIIDKPIYTICRSYHTNTKRYYLDRRPTTAKENTAYSAIIDDNQPNFFICKDLTKWSEEQGLYINHNANYLRFYQSLVVVPISKEISYSENDLNAHNIIYGFLCLDYKNELSDKKIDTAYNFAMIYATIIKEYIDCYYTSVGGYVSDLFR